VFPEIPVDALLAIWEEIDQEPTVGDPAPTEINDPTPTPTCKHKFLIGRNTKTQCRTKVKWGGEYCSKHKK